MNVNEFNKKWDKFWDNFNQELYKKYKIVKLLRSTGFFINNSITHKDPKELVNIDELIEQSNHKNIVLYNDDVNSFQHVIECLVNFCDHHPLQAEQCSIIVHNKGKCGVKVGTYEELEPICTTLLEKGLSAEIE